MTASSNRRVVLVTHYYPAHGGGIELVAVQLVRRLAADHGFKVMWFASDTEQPPTLPGVRTEPMQTLNVVERITGGMPYPLWGFGSLVRLARAIRVANVIHVHDAIYFGSLFAATLARWYGKRLVVTQHVGQVPIANPLLRATLAVGNRIAARFVLAHAHAVIFISLVVKAYFEGLVGPRASFHYIPNGVDVPLFHLSNHHPEELRRNLGFDPSRPLLLFVGRFVPKKRLPVIRALAEATPEWQWCLIGSGPEDPRGWGLPNVEVRGPISQSELVSYYQAAELLVLPSEGEGFPLVIQESMACGLPACFSPNIAAAADLPGSLFIALSPDRAETVALIRAWLSQGADARLAVRSACASHAIGHWNWDKATARHAAFIHPSDC